MSSHQSGPGFAFVHNVPFPHIRNPLLVRALRWCRIGGLAGLGLVTATVVVQLLYPHRYATPLLRVQGIAVGMQQSPAVAASIAPLETAKVTLRTPAKSYYPTYKELGVHIDEQQTARYALQYSWRDRLVPFTLFRRSAAAPVKVQYDQASLQRWAKRIAKENAVPAVNASAQKQGTHYVAVPAVNGAGYDTLAIVRAFKAANPLTTSTIAVPHNPTPPQIPTDAAEQVVQHVNRLLSKPFQLSIEGVALAFSPEELAGLTQLVPNLAAGTIDVQYDRASIKARVAQLASQIYIPSTQTVVTLLDGAEAARTQGQAGRAVAVDAAVDQIVTVLQRDGGSLELKAQPLSVSSRVIRTYSPTSQGLQVLINDWKSDTGLRASVVVKELGGRGRYAEIQPAVNYISASMYKVYTASYLYDGIRLGTIDPNSQLGIAQSVSSCLDAMIVVSDNNCPRAIAGVVGWNSIMSFAQNNGMAGTDYQGGNVVTSARDFAVFLEKLHNTTLLSSEHTSALLANMHKQIYREGIPRGVRGIPVANKVGYVSGYRHDGGIVYHPRGTYILVVMTYGATPAQIADLSQRINNFMNQ